MELQLGLALPSNTVFGLDLNSGVYKPKDVGGSGSQLNHHHHRTTCLQLGPQSCVSKSSITTTSTSSHDSSSSSSNNNNKNTKRSFCIAFDEIRDNVTPPRTLPLLLWNNQPNDEDNYPNRDSHHNFSFAFNKIEEDSDEGITGWPPIKFRRKKIRHHHHNSHGSQNNGMENTRRVDNGCAYCHGRPSNYVKVKMDGVPIARKIDLSLYTSFQALKDTLLSMFGICQENSTSYRLIYQDREGDWLLADDVSWRSFIWSVQRLKLMKINNGRVL